MNTSNQERSQPGDACRELYRLACRVVLDLVGTSDIPQCANALLLAQSKNSDLISPLLELSLAGNREDTLMKLQSALSSCGIDWPNKVLAVLVLSSDVAREVLASTITVYDGALRINGLYEHIRVGNNIKALDNVYAWVEEYECGVIDLARFEREIRSVAMELVVDPKYRNGDLA